MYFGTMFAQNTGDLYDLNNSMRFADYLYANQQYQFAINEYQRVLFLDPKNTRATIYLYESFFRERQYGLALERIKKQGLPVLFKNDTICAIYHKLLLFTNQHGKIQENVFVRQSCLNMEDQLIFRTSSLLLQDKANDLKFSLGEKKLVPGELEEIILSARDIQPKKPWISLTSSAVVPGSGKIYSGYWKDGLMTLLFVSATAWQSYRGFSKKGVESIYGWLFGGLSISFYAGNLYGSVKAAHKRNQVMYHEIHEEVYEYVEGKYSY
jgi:tetratricopeptide (TPR) repeat protein